MAKKKTLRKGSRTQTDDARSAAASKKQMKIGERDVKPDNSPVAEGVERSEQKEERFGDPGRHECVVVGIGASAGGLDAYKRLLQHLPANTGMAFVLVQHLDPTHESLMVELLSKYTAMPVLQVKEATPIETNHVYMIPPNRFIKIADGGLFLDEPVTRRGVRLPIDYFFRSLAQARKERAICVVLSGTGSDGADGIREVKAEGGMTIVQKPETAEYDGMPRAAISTGAVDFALPIEEMAEVIVPYARHPYVQAKPKTTLAESAPDHFRAILSLLRAHTDQDFSRYKKGTLTRRIDRRMGIRQIDKPADYLKLLREDGEELQRLFKDFLIGVTRFFRDSQAWEDLTGVLAGKILEKRDEEPFRVWVPGCASGEEAYSIAMLLFEQQQRQNRRLDIQVFATDVDADAIAIARLGLYPENIAKDVAESRLDIYFQREGERFRVRKKLRETCIFAVQNLLSDPPFSNLDLISCRNLLIYLEPDVQRRVFDMLHFALAPAGLLFLGSSESPAKRKHLFDAISQPSRIYRKVGVSKPGSGGFPIDSGRARITADLAQHAEHDTAKSPGTAELSKRALLEEFAPASVVVNHRGLIQFIHGPIRDYLDFPTGEPDLDLTAMALDGLKAKTRTALQQVRSSGETVSIVAPRVNRNGKQVAVRVRVHPLPTAKGSDPLYLVSFLDEVSLIKSAEAPPRGDQQPHEISAQQAESDHQLALELQATREDLQSTIEELESANEELKASNEEVMSMNEELQSTNEELETSREELQSLNEELSTVNSQLHDKVQELEATTNDLTNLLASTDMATLFLDADLCIRRYTPATTRLMNIIDSDVGRPISDLSTRVNDSSLVSDAREVLERLTPVENEVCNGGQKWFMRRIMPFRTSENKIEGVVVTFTDITQIKHTCQRLEFRERQQAVIAQLGRTALAGDDLQSLFLRATRDVAKTLELDLCEVLRLEPNGREFRLIAGVGWGDGLVGQATVPVGIKSQAGYTLQTAGPVIVENLNKEKRFSIPGLLDEHGAVSGITVLIGPEENPWGVLGAHTRRQETYAVDDANFLLAVANVLWEAIRRKAVETELRMNEARTAAFLNISTVIAWMKDDKGRHTYLSVNYESRFNVKLEDWLGKTDDEVWPAEIAERFRENDRRVIETGEPLEVVEEAMLPDGSRAFFLNMKFPFTDADGNRYVGGLGLDITDRVRAQQDLDRERAMLQAVLDAMPAGVFIADARGRILQANGAACELWGTPPKTNSWEEYAEWVAWWPDTGERIKAEEWAMSRALVHGEVTRNELIQNQRFDSQERRYFLNNAAPVHGAEGQIVGGVVATLDVTERIAAQRALAESEERLRLAAEMAGFGTYLVIFATGEVTWSPELKAIFGLAPDAPVNADAAGIPDFVHPDDRDRVARKAKATLDPAGNGRFQDEHRIVRADGEVRWVFVRGRTLFEGTGGKRRPVRTAGVALDITDRHRSQEELEAARRAAEAASEAKSTFLANMSHEIRTPMTAILGYADVLCARLSDPDAQACVRTIKENGSYLCDIINDILDLSKIEAGKLRVHAEPCSIFDILADVRSLMTMRATEKNLTLSVDFDSELPATIRTDKKMVRQILVNLVGNAVKFTERGGVQMVARCLPEREMLEVAVRDTGIGVEPEQIERLFLPFEQLDNSFTRTAGGSGLGLAISRRFVELLGGEIAVESAVGKGSTFRFTVTTGPLDEAEWVSPDSAALQDRQKAEALPFDQLPRLSGRILAVDDRPEIRVLVREFVESSGGEVEVAEDGQQCVDTWIAARDDRKPFDVVLMDIQMPVMDGLEATRRLRAEGFRGPILALTANALRSDQEKCLEAGCDAFVAKPIDRAELVGKLALWLDGSDTGQPAAGTTAKQVLFVDDHPAMREIHTTLLEERGHDVRTAASGDEALRLADEIAFDVAVIDLNLRHMSGGELVTHLKSKPLQANCVFVCYTGLGEDEVPWQEMGFHHFLQKPANEQDFDRVLGDVDEPSEPHEAAAELHVFDPEGAVRKCFGNDKMFRTMVDSFFEEAEPALADLRRAVKHENPETLRAAAHRLKNTVAFLAAPLAYAAAERLEAIGQSGDVTEAPEAIRHLAAELDELANVLQAYRESRD